MKKIFTILNLAALLFCCSNLSAQSCGPNSYNWADMVAIFTSNNCTGCHGNQGGLDLSNYQNTVTGGNNGMGGCGPSPTALAFLVAKVDGSLSQLSGCGDPMPSPTPFGTPGMQQADLLALKTWIAAGAPETCQVQNPCTIGPGQNICAILQSNPNDPLASLDCDTGGVINIVECLEGTNPLDPADDCQAAIAANLDICDLINNDPTHPLASQDCDMGGVRNLQECINGTNPSVTSDDNGVVLDCTNIPVGQTICGLINGNSNHPLATLDCDNGGIDNITECQSGTDPLAAIDDCEAAINGSIDICALISGTPGHPLATLDCDEGGVDNSTECAAGTNPSVALDDCQAAINGNVNICLLINNDPNHPLAGLDCDMGGVANLQECINGTDPSVTSDDMGGTQDCITISPGQDICVLINGNSNHPLASLDCDMGGVINITECAVGTDPLDASDDCRAAIDAGLDICLLIGGNLSHPLANLDCDMGGVINITECLNGTNPSEPSDDNPGTINCTNIPIGQNICALINGNANHPLATLDCDNGGIDNLTECLVGTDPLMANDDCQAAINGNVDICAILAGTLGHPLASQDCDMGGVINITECLNGTNPSDPSDDLIILDCNNLPPNSNICALIDNDVTHPLATLDCDNGGIDNITECKSGTDPTVASDDCQAAIIGNIDICGLINSDPNHPLANLDCDMGGVINITECQNGTDPSEPSDDIVILNCNNLPPITTICALINGDPNHPLAELDCDNGGVDNITECLIGTDPSVASDDCQAAINGNLNICTLINNDPNHPLANQDCDMGGVANLQECINGTDPSVKSDDNGSIDCTLLPQNICALINGDPNHPLATLDCDNGGIDNLTECLIGTNPLVASDDCQAAINGNINICALIQSTPGHPLTSLDCDMGGVINIIECMNGTDPSEPSDDVIVVINCTNIPTGADICVLINGDPNHPLATLDCDNGGVDNYTECTNNGEPGDPADDCEIAILANLNICLLIDNDPNHPLATLDCDMGGVINITECTNGTDPSVPSDDMPTIPQNCTNLPAGSDICVLINGDPNHPLATLDCDNGGVNNYIECTNNGEPEDPADDCDLAILVNLDICMLINGDLSHPLATLDCDNGGVINITECTNGTDPSVASDDIPVQNCTNLPTGSDICTLINNDPTHPLAQLDCDNGGVSNYFECISAENPTDPSDDCQTAIDEDLFICALITSGGVLDPTHPLANQDCDNGGVSNITECTNGTDPSEPSDDIMANDVPDLTPVTTIIPGNISGISTVGVVVEVSELLDNATDGTAIQVRIPADPRLTFTYDPTLTNVGFNAVQNSQWTYNGVVNGLFHEFVHNGVLPGLSTLAFGFNSTYDPQGTSGQTTITATVFPFSGGELNVSNNSDSEQLVYFN